MTPTSPTPLDLDALRAAEAKMTPTKEGKPMRLDAYYYSFDSTGNETIDRVLSAVACAGKAFHNTSEWSEPSDSIAYEPFLRGATCAEQINNAAHDAAAEIERLRKALGEAVTRLCDEGVGEDSEAVAAWRKMAGGEG